METDEIQQKGLAKIIHRLVVNLGVFSFKNYIYHIESMYGLFTYI